MADGPGQEESAGRLRGRVAAVTGGGSGIGRAVVDRFVDEGCAVVVLELSAERARALQHDHGPNVVVVQGDATTLDDNRSVVAAAIENFGHLDCFVANTGFWDFGVTVEDLPDDARFDEAFDQIFALNVKALLAGAKAAASELRQTHGSLIMTASNASLHPGGGGPLYTAAKHAVIGLTRQLAYELAPDVRVNAVAPGGMLTALAPPPALSHAARDIGDLPMEPLISMVSPLGFLPKPADYAGWYVALASEHDALTITGTVIECDGGEAVRGRAFSEHARKMAGDPRAANATPDDGS